MRILVSKDVLRVLNDVLRRILASSDKIKRFKGRVITELNMRVRRRKIRFRKKKTTIQILLGKEKTEQSRAT